MDALLWTVAHRTTAQLWFLFFIPALFTEVREESCNLSAGGNHRVYEERKRREELLRRLRQEDCKIGTNLGNQDHVSKQNKTKTETGYHRECRVEAGKAVSIRFRTLNHSVLE